MRLIRSFASSFSSHNDLGCRSFVRSRQISKSFLGGRPPGGGLRSTSGPCYEFM